MAGTFKAGDRVWINDPKQGSDHFLPNTPAIVEDAKDCCSTGKVVVSTFNANARYREIQREVMGHAVILTSSECVEHITLVEGESPIHGELWQDLTDRSDRLARR